MPRGTPISSICQYVRYRCGPEGTSYVWYCLRCGRPVHGAIRWVDDCRLERTCRKCGYTVGVYARAPGEEK